MYVESILRCCSLLNMKVIWVYYFLLVDPYKIMKNLKITRSRRWIYWITYGSVKSIWLFTKLKIACLRICKASLRLTHSYLTDRYHKIKINSSSGALIKMGCLKVQFCFPYYLMYFYVICSSWSIQRYCKSCKW